MLEPLHSLLIGFFSFSFTLTKRLLSSNHHEQGFGNIIPRFCKLIKLQYINENLILLLRCTFKVTVVLVALFRINFIKYSFNRKPNLVTSERDLMVLLFLPLVIMSLASNRIYVANTITKHFLMMYAKELNCAAPNNSLKIKLCAVNYRCLHVFFSRFNKLNAISYPRLLLSEHCIRSK